MKKMKLELTSYRRRQLETEKSYSYLQEKLDNNEIIEAESNRSS